MNKKIYPARVEGIVSAPASKSMSQRAIAIASLANGISEIYNVGNSEDVYNCIQVVKLLGVRVSGNNNNLMIEGGIRFPEQILDCGESGLSIRMFAGIAATFGREITLTGKNSLLQRPMASLQKSLISIGVNCNTSGNKPPVFVKGPFRGGKYYLDGSEGSQALTGILIASPMTGQDVHLLVDNLKSKPYIDMTLEAMKAFGVQVENNQYREFFISANQVYKPASYIVEGDWSGAAFLLVAGATAGRVQVNNLKTSSRQADKAILQALSLAGAEITIKDNSAEARKDKLEGFSFDATDCPDLFPPLVALAAHCRGKSFIKGTERLKSKESDRASTLQKEFGKMGLKIEIENDTMIITGSALKPAKVFSHGDHRIAMACAVAALTGTGEVEIENSESVEKSYPCFFEDLESITKNNY